jgi:general secretion pathway protein K
MNNQRGIALILVLFFSVILSSTLIVYQYRKQSLQQQTYQINDFMQARAELLSIKEELKFKLATTPIWFNGVTQDVLAQHGLPPTFNLWGRTFDWQQTQVSIADTSGLLSVIPFERDQWRHTLMALQIEKYENLLDEFSDWIDQDAFLHLNGAEQREYGNSVQVRNDLPQSVDELRMLRSMDDSSWQLLRPILSYFGQGQYSREYIPDALLEPLLGEYNATEISDRRSANPENKIELSNSGGDSMSSQFPSSRLRVQLRVVKGDAVYQESFVLVRGLGVKQFLFETEVSAGFSSMEHK